MDEMRLIDAYKLKSLIEDFPEWMKFDKDRVIKTIDNAPTIAKCGISSEGLPLMDLRPKPTGEWLSTGKDLKREHPYSAKWYCCSYCGKVNDFNQMTNYCPYCGAKMVKGGEGE